MYVNDVARSSVNANYTAQSKIFKKISKGYNYDTKKITYELEVNEDKKEFKDLVITDQLISGVTLDKDSVKVTQDLKTEAITDDTLSKPYYIYDEVTNELKIYLKETKTGDAMYKVNFDVAVNTQSGVFKDGKSFVTENGNIVVSNCASLKTKGPDNNQNVQSSDADQPIKNNILDKTFTASNGVASYQVKINQAKNLINSKVTDTMSAGLKLKLSTVKLYNATIASDGNYSQDTEVAADDYEISTEKLADGRTKMEVTLPAGNGAYILKYDAQVCNDDPEYQSKGYTNEVNMNGVIDTSGDATNNIVV